MNSFKLAFPYLTVIMVMVGVLMTRDSEICLVCGGKRKDINMAFGVSIIYIFLFAALRGNGNGDYFEYLNRGVAIREAGDILHNNISMNVGYPALAWVVNQLHLPSQSVIAMMNAISIGCIYHTVKIYSVNPGLSMLVFLPFYFQYDMHAARTAVAISLLTLCIPYVIERKPIKFTIVVILATLFHPEVMIGILLYFLPLFSINMVVGLLILLTGSVGTFFNIYDKIILFFLRVLSADYLYDKFNGYVHSERFGYAAKIYDPRLLLVILIFVLAKKYLLYENEKEKKYNNFLINSCFFAAVTMIFFNAHTFMVYRLSSVFNIFTLFLVPVICRDYKKSVCYHYKCKMYVGTIVVYMLLSVAYIFFTTSVEYKICTLQYWN